MPEIIGSNLEKCILMMVKGSTLRHLLKAKSSDSMSHRAQAMKMSSHRKYCSISLALKKFLSRNKPFGISVGTEHISLDKATDRILARNIRCPIDIPPFQRSTVDGYAIRSSDAKGTSRNDQVMLNVIGKINAGKNARTKISSGEAIAVATGAKIPLGADSVVMIEDVLVEDEGRKIRISDKIYNGSNITPKGNDLE